MMKWVLIAIAVPVLLGALVYGIGLALPKNHVARAELLVPAPPAAVAAIVRDVEAQPRWRSGVARVEVLERGRGTLRYVEHGDEAIAFDFAEVEPGARFRSVIADPTLPFGGAWTIVLAAEDGGTRVRIEERGEVRHPLYRFFSRFVFGHEQTMRTYLADLDQAARQGVR